MKKMRKISCTQANENPTIFLDRHPITALNG